MNEPTDWALLARYLSDECSDEEQARVEAWIASDPENQRLMASMNIVWGTPEPLPQASDVNRLWDEVTKKTGIAAPPADSQASEAKGGVVRVAKWFHPRAYSMMRYAAVLLVAAGLAYVFQLLPWNRQADELNLLAVGKGDREEITLSDGTRIALDAGSRLKYPNAFEEDHREVFLSGEGYFEVASSVEKPFVIHANHAVVKVLGTKFNVRAWEPDQRVTVTVAEGKVSLRSETGREAVVVVQGQMSTLTEGGQPSEPQTVDVEKHLGWMHNEVFFDGTSLQEILYQMERWYDVEFVLADSSVATEELSLHFQDHSLDDALELVSVLTDLGYERSGKSVRFRSRQ